MTFVVDLFFSFRSRREVNRKPDVLRRIVGAGEDLCDSVSEEDRKWSAEGRTDAIDPLFRLPRPDPIVQNMTTLEIAAEQPYIYRLTRLGAAAQIEGRSLEFADASV
jgi:hypothetical protein